LWGKGALNAGKGREEYKKGSNAKKEKQIKLKNWVGKRPKSYELETIDPEKRVEDRGGMGKKPARRGGLRLGRWCLELLKDEKEG